MLFSTEKFCIFQGQNTTFGGQCVIFSDTQFLHGLAPMGEKSSPFGVGESIKKSYICHKQLPNDHAECVGTWSWCLVWFNTRSDSLAKARRYRVPKSDARSHLQRNQFKTKNVLFRTSKTKRNRNRRFWTAHQRGRFGSLFGHSLRSCSASPGRHWTGADAFVYDVVYAVEKKINFM